MQINNSIRLCLLAFVLLSDTLFASTLPCLDKAGRLDIECRCKKRKACMGAMTKSEKTSLKKLNAEVPGQYIMQITKKSIPGLKAMKKALNGEYTSKNFPYKQFKKIDKDMERVTEALVKKAESKMKELKIKPYKIEDRIKIFRKRDAAIYKKIAKPKKNIKIGSLELSQNVNAEDDQVEKVSDDDSKNKIKDIQGNENSKLAKVNEFKYQDVSSEVNKTLNKNFKYKNSILSKNTNIFKTISARYIVKMNSLDQRVIQLALSGFDQESLREYLSSKMIKIYKY